MSLAIKTVNRSMGLRMLQYVSDMHVDRLKRHELKDTLKHFPIKTTQDIAICGDVGLPEHENWKETMSFFSNNYENVFFVPGNHEFDCSPLYSDEKVKKWDSCMQNILSKYKNIHYMQRKIFELNSSTLIMGCTLWSHLTKRCDKDIDSEIFKKYVSRHNEEHDKHVKFIREHIQGNKNNKNYKNIIILTHYVPTKRLIEDKYKNIEKPYTDKNGISSFFATDLETLTNNTNITTWVCGHSHTTTSVEINGVSYLMNANTEFHHIGKYILHK
ncbi:MAG: metallophosphatase [Terrestrivirus sp.]|uniref:Metallophosphatase n=1 Tax=Terrestrivirus sp. TaxID=2487775 RepID=A0A3G4ZM45_9VIRU|nr:MAG: metallophosphatase [Terrestrivirus sp.]